MLLLLSKLSHILVPVSSTGCNMPGPSPSHQKSYDVKHGFPCLNCNAPTSSGESESYFICLSDGSSPLRENRIRMIGTTVLAFLNNLQENGSIFLKISNLSCTLSVFLTCTMMYTTLLML